MNSNETMRRWKLRAAETMRPKLLLATAQKSCDGCAAQEGRHYCLLHGVQIKNMDAVRCADWEGGRP